MIYQAFNQGQSLLTTLLGDVGRIYRHILFLENLFAFLDLEQAISDPAKPQPVPIPLLRGVQFRSVSFAYPGSDRKVLDNFDLYIPAGKTVALVGENGAGKSTLVKLLCRFYDPLRGRIELDGTDLRDFAQEELRAGLSVMFQRPVPYHATAAANVAMGKGAGAFKFDEVERAARSAGAHGIIMGLPKQYQTLLGKWFLDGTGLSEGEWQRIALARAFVRDKGLILLDEPTSAMDSWAEAEWMDRFAQLADGRTALIITHRFTTAMRADLVYVMRQGHIVEAGTHDMLLNKGGIYAQSWRRQYAAGNGRAARLAPATTG